MEHLKPPLSIVRERSSFEIKMIAEELAALVGIGAVLEHGTLDFNVATIGVVPEDGSQEASIEGRFLSSFLKNYICGKEQRQALTDGLLQWVNHCIDERRMKLEVEGIMKRRHLVLQQFEKVDLETDLLAITVLIPPTLAEIHQARFALSQYADHGKHFVTLPMTCHAVFIKRGDLQGEDVQWLQAPQESA